MKNIDSPHNKNPSISVIDSVLNSRIDQMIALTLPSDKHRHDILQTIKTTYSMSQRLSSFCDYMIDYIETLSSKLEKTKNELHEINHHSSKLNKEIKHSIKHCSKKHKQSKHDRRFDKARFDFNEINFNIDNENDNFEIDSDVEYNSPILKCDDRKSNKKDDYLSTLKLLNAQEGQLSITVNDLIQQNLRLQRLHNQDRAILLKQHAVIHGFDDPASNKNNFSINCDDINNESSTDSDCCQKTKRKKRKSYSESYSDNDDGIIGECKQLKSDFQQISNEIKCLNSQVQQRYHYCKKRCRHC